MAVACAIESGRLSRRPSSDALGPPLAARRRGLSPARVLTLQRVAGNQAVTRALAGWGAADASRAPVLGRLDDPTLWAEYETLLARILALGTAAEREADEHYLELIAEELILRYLWDARTSLTWRRGSRPRPAASDEGRRGLAPPELLPEGPEEVTQAQAPAAQAIGSAPGRPEPTQVPTQEASGPEPERPAPDHSAAGPDRERQRRPTDRERPAPSADPQPAERRRARPGTESRDAASRSRRPSLAGTGRAVAGSALSAVGGLAAARELKKSGTGRAEIELAGLNPRDFKLGRVWRNVPLGSDEHGEAWLGTVRVERNPHRRKRFYLVQVRAG